MTQEFANLLEQYAIQDANVMVALYIALGAILAWMVFRFVSQKASAPWMMFAPAATFAFFHLFVWMVTI